MTTIFRILMPLCLLLAVASCKNEKVDMGRYVAERDSILLDNKNKTQQLDELNGILTTIATGLDSIAVQENILFSGSGRDGVSLDRHQIAARLNGMADILARQRQKIQMLQDSMASQKPSQAVAQLQRVVKFLNQQLAEKDQMIKSLRADLNNSKKDITQLRASLSSMQTRADKAEHKSQMLTNALSKQDEIINECYVKIGTKKQLAAAGLLKGGFLAKKKVNYSEVDKSKFNAVDIRKFREIQLKSDNPKILTPLPNNRSYHFEENGDGSCTLVITNPTQFWSVSNFLIIQL